MFQEEIRAKQDLSYISVCSLNILYNSKFILMETSLGTNAVVVTRVHCIYAPSEDSDLPAYLRVYQSCHCPLEDIVDMLLSKELPAKTLISAGWHVRM